MKKLFLIIALALIVLAGYAVVNPEFRSWLKETAGTAPETSRVYKWKDTEGTWHITNTPPPPGTAYIEQEVLHNANVVPAVIQEKN